VTIGDDAETASAIESWGATHVTCRVEEIAVDERLKIASTPAYMLGPWIAQIATGIDKLVSAVLEMT
jgi:enhancing lycopene biosynthesis protein 2